MQADEVAGLLFCGVDKRYVEEVGSIEPLPRQEPYSLPQEFH